MGKVILEMSISLDGFSAGPDISPEQPMGKAGDRLHHWQFDEKTQIDEEIISEIFATSGAVIVGGNTYHVAIDKAWGGVSPFPMPAFVVTQTIPERHVEGFTYVATGIDHALQSAKRSADEKNVWVMGGAKLSQSFIKAGLVDELHIHLIPVILGSGTRLFENIGMEHIELVRTELVGTTGATHIFFRVVK